MFVLDGDLHPKAMTTFIRTIPSPADHQLAQFLPDAFVQDHTVRLRETTKVNRSAQFRAWDGNFPHVERDYTETRELALLPLGVSASKGELERLQIEFAKLKGGDTTAIINALYDDAELGVRYIRNRMERARGELLSTGKVTLAGENGVYQTADFGVPGTHFVNAATPWTTVATAPVVEDLHAWAELYQADAGEAPGGMIISKKTAGLLQRNAQFREYANIVAGGPNLVSKSVVNQVLSDFSLPPIALVYDTQLGDYDGNNARVIPENKVIFVPNTASDLGSVKWGISPTSLELTKVADMSFSDAPGIVGVVNKAPEPPFSEWTFVDAAAFPVLENPKKLLVATVY